MTDIRTQFATTLEDMIHDHLVCDVKNSSIEVTMTEQSLMLKQVHYLARVIETAKQNLKGVSLLMATIKARQTRSIVMHQPPLPLRDLPSKLSLSPSKQ